ncbi:MAG TPA: hypothetical protein VKB11_00915 [Acidimicrobiia bacterium]|nr:hypothetical protein [Acidimicrobiia bacterium]
MSRNRKMWMVVMGLGVVMILVGVAWIVFYATQATGDLNPETGAYESDSWMPILGLFVSFFGGTLITMGSLGCMFSWFSGDDDKYQSSAGVLRQSVPTTRVGWVPGPQTKSPARNEARVQHPGFVTVA